MAFIKATGLPRTLQRLKRASAILVCILCTVVSPQSAMAETQGEKLDGLRQKYEVARANFAKTQDYGKPYRESIESAQELVKALLDHWMSLPGDDGDLPGLQKEITKVFKDLAGSPLTEKYNQGKSFMARTAWPLLAGKKPTPGQAAFLAGLTKPQMGVRMND